MSRDDLVSTNESRIGAGLYLERRGFSEPGEKVGDGNGVTAANVEGAGHPLLEQASIGANHVAYVSEVAPSGDGSSSDYGFPLSAKYLGLRDLAREIRHHITGALARPGMIERPGANHADTVSLGVEACQLVTSSLGDSVGTQGAKRVVLRNRQ